MNVLPAFEKRKVTSNAGKRRNQTSSPEPEPNNMLRKRVKVRLKTVSLYISVFLTRPRNAKESKPDTAFPPPNIISEVAIRPITNMNIEAFRKSSLESLTYVELYETAA